MSDDIIKRALGMNDEPTEEEPKALVPYEITTEESKAIDLDFDEIHANFTDYIEKGTDALNEIIIIAKQSQHPRAFEVLSTLLKTIADLNMNKISLHKKKLDLKPKDVPHTKGTGGITNNNLFVGSTAEIQKILENMNKKNNE
jgi:hypothetical protein